MAANAGWYDDGQRPGFLRWWDGQSWSDTYEPVPQVPAPAPAPAIGLPPEATTAPAAAAQPRPVAYRFPSSTSWPNIEVMGESNYDAAIVAAIGKRPKVDEEIEVNLDAVLVPEPDNPYDTNAISVRIKGKVVGYLEREVAPLYKPHVDRITASGHLPTTIARLWASTRSTWDNSTVRLVSNVRLALTEPHVLVPLNDPPKEKYSVIPWGAGLQVTGEDKHFDVLAPHVTDDGRGLLLVTLHRGTEQKARTVAEFIEVRVDGQRVGQMTGASSAHYFPLVDHLEKKGMIAAAWAHLKGSGLAAEVVLQAAKAAEIDSAWLNGKPVTIPELIPVAKSYLVPAAYSGPPKPNGKKPGGGAPSAARAATGKPAPDKAKAKAGCGMVVAFVVGLAGLATIPDVGFVAAGATALATVVALSIRRQMAARGA